MISCGSLHLILSVIRWRLYDDSWSIHQSDYRRRPVQAPSPLLLGVLGSSLWILRNFPSTRFLPLPIVALSIKISLSFLSDSFPSPSTIPFPHDLWWTGGHCPCTLQYCRVSPIQSLKSKSKQMGFYKLESSLKVTVLHDVKHCEIGNSLTTCHLCDSWEESSLNSFYLSDLSNEI